MNSKTLFCFTHAGGTSEFFNDIEADLSEIDIAKLEYAGHGERHKEPFYSSFDELADDLYKTIKERDISGNYGLFGYSMGSISLIEVLRRIIDDPDIQNPYHIFIAAHEPHTKAELVGFSPVEQDEWVKQRTIHFGAVPENLINNRPFWRMYLPIYRADYSLIGEYDFDKLDFSTKIPASVFYSETDTPRKEVEQWKKHFVGDCSFYRFEGTHFFIKEHHKEMAEIIRKVLMGDNNNDF